MITVTETMPVPAGDVDRERWCGLVTSTEVPSVEPKSTVVEPVTKPVPVTVTEVPPAWGPLVGLTMVTVGAALYV